MINTEMKRNILYSLSSISMIFFICLQTHAQKGLWKKDLLQYINKNLTKADGGYGWGDQPDSHIEPTLAVVGILNDISELPTDRTAWTGFIKTHHPQRQSNKATGPREFDGRPFL